MKAQKTKYFGFANSEGKFTKSSIKDMIKDSLRTISTRNQFASPDPLTQIYQQFSQLDQQNLQQELELKKQIQQLNQKIAFQKSYTKQLTSTIRTNDSLIYDFFAPSPARPGPDFYLAKRHQKFFISLNTIFQTELGLSLIAHDFSGVNDLFSSFPSQLLQQIQPAKTFNQIQDAKIFQEVGKQIDKSQLEQNAEIVALVLNQPQSAENGEQQQVLQIQKFFEEIKLKFLEVSESYLKILQQSANYQVELEKVRKVKM